MKRVKSVKIESIEDIEALPEGEWVHVPAGTKVRWVGLEEAKAAAGFEVTLSAREARALRALHGTKLRATLRGRTLVLKKQPARRGP